MNVSGHWWDALRRDFRYSTRILARNPAFAVAAVLTLSLGLGINTAMFSVVNEALLKPLPLPEPDQLTSIFNFDQKSAKYLSTSCPDYRDLAVGPQSFSQIAAYVRLPFDLKNCDETERIAGEPVSTNYFSMLELPPLIGRSFNAADDASGSAVGHDQRRTLARPLFSGLQYDWQNCPVEWPTRQADRRCPGTISRGELELE